MAAQTKTTAPTVYIASLADYNAGRLHGVRVQVESAEQLQRETEKMLAASREPFAEEWAIHDYEGFGPHRVYEYDSFEDVATVAAFIAEHGEAAHAFLSIFDTEDIPSFEQRYMGDWGDRETFAAEIAEELLLTHEVHEDVARYFDFEGYCRTLFLGEYRESDGHIFLYDLR